MSDRIIVNRIAVFAHHGVYEAEATLGQRFFISLEARVDTRLAGRSDDVADTVSYVEMTAIASEIATTRRFHLIETLAEAIAELCLAEPRVIEARIGIAKLEVEPAASGVGVEIERRRSARPVSVLPSPGGAGAPDGDGSAAG